MNMLAVDDSPVILGYLKDLLGEEGYEVETTSNGAQALDKYHNSTSSKIYCDA